MAFLREYSDAGANAPASAFLTKQTYLSSTDASLIGLMDEKSCDIFA